MKRNFTLICLILQSIFCLNAQTTSGLEGIIVERYYVSDANDTVANATDGRLPVGSVTYRVFVDMLPGYKLQALFGLPAPNFHELKFSTTTLFFNNEDRGAITPTYTKTQAKGASVMLDSWVSMGAACTGNHGILKTEDDGVANVVNTNSPLMLQNANPSAGIPLTIQDGLIVKTFNPQTVTLVGITNTELALVDNTNDTANGKSFVTSNGSIAALAGAVGPDTIVNKVLIGQFTTDGVFSFQLNLQLGTPTGGTQQFVAVNPVGNEILFPALNYSSALEIRKISNTLNAFELFPNPGESTLKILIQSNNSNAVNNNVAIYDILGRKIIEQNIGKLGVSNVETIDVSSLKTGKYIVELNLDGVRTSKKYIKN
jgi:hypothetical protein